MYQATYLTHLCGAGTGVRTAVDGTRSQVSYERGRLVNSISTLSTQKKGPPAGTKKAAVAAARPGSAKGRAPPKPEAPAPDHGFLMDGKTAARDMYDGEFPHGFDLIFAG